MVEISLTSALALYSALVLAGMFFIWLYTEVRTHHVYEVLEKQYLWRCVFCTFTYLDEAAEKISRCPRCHSLNSVEDVHSKFVRLKNFAEPALAEETEDPRRNPSRKKRPGAKQRGPRRRR